MLGALVEEGELTREVVVGELPEVDAPGMRSLFGCTYAFGGR